MTLHLIKLCVGCDSIDDLVEWIDFRMKEARRARRPLEHIHTTRMVPKRATELLAGGSTTAEVGGAIPASVPGSPVDT